MLRGWLSVLAKLRVSIEVASSGVSVILLGQHIRLVLIQGFGLLLL